MSKELIGQISGVIVFISAIPYMINVFTRKINPKFSSWFLWTIISLSLLITYKSAGATTSIWAAVVGFTNPLLILIFIYFRIGHGGKFDKLEKWCIAISLTAIVLWYFFRNDPSLAQYALYLSIVADACAAIPTIIWVWKNPLEDKPFAWGLFAIGYGLSAFAVTEPSVSNYILPCYMFFGSSLITMPLILYRVRQRVPAREWI